MFTIQDYVGVHKNSPDWTVERQENARRLIEACTGLQERMEADGVIFKLNPRTKTTISGETFGGFRPQDCCQGAQHSSHKEGLAVDRFDPVGEIDSYIMSNQSLLVEFGIYIEHPNSTDGWSHWSIKPPESGRHVFNP